MRSGLATASLLQQSDGSQKVHRSRQTIMCPQRPTAAVNRESTSAIMSAGITSWKVDLPPEMAVADLPLKRHKRAEPICASQNERASDAWIGTGMAPSQLASPAPIRRKATGGVCHPQEGFSLRRYVKAGGGRRVEREHEPRLRQECRIWGYDCVKAVQQNGLTSS
jgi:hypothetical protein